MAPLLVIMTLLNRTQQKELARLYYILQGLTAKETAEKVGVSEKTLNKWVDELGWKALKAGELTKPDRLIANCYDNILQIQEDARKQDRGLNAKEADAIYKISLTIKGINKEFSIDVYSAVLQEYFNFLKTIDLALAQTSIDAADSFFHHKIKQLSK